MKHHTSKQILRILKVSFAACSVAVVAVEGELANPDAGALLQLVATAWLAAGALTPRQRKGRDFFVLADYGLTPREIDFTSQVLDGKAVKEIAIDCKVKPSTVRTAMSQVYAKLGIEGARQLFEIGAIYEVR